MPVIVHLRSGQNEELRQAATCEWISAPDSTSSSTDAQRVLICKDQYGNVVETYREAQIDGFRIVNPAASSRLRFRRKRQSVSA